MNQDLFYTFQIASTFSVLLPLVPGVLSFRKHDDAIKIFVLFLATGFIVDLLGWYFFLSKNADGNIYTRDFYGLAEVLLLFWFICRVATNRLIKFVLAKAWLVLIPVWFVGMFYRDIIIVCRTTSEVVLAFASSFCLLSRVENHSEASKDLVFWLLLGIFFYFFSTFFFMSLLSTQLGLKLWYLHNFVNIGTNLVYFWGFMVTRRSTDFVGPSGGI